MMNGMSASLFLDWAEFDRVCLLGEDRSDIRLAAIAWLSAVHSFNWGKAHGAKGGQVPKLEDFVYDADKATATQKGVQSMGEMKARLKGFSAAHNAFVAQQTK